MYVLPPGHSLETLIQLTVGWAEIVSSYSNLLRDFTLMALGINLRSCGLLCS